MTSNPETLTDIIASAGVVNDIYDQLLAADTDYITYNGSQEWGEDDIMDQLETAAEMLSNFVTPELTIESALAWTARTNIYRGIGLDHTGHDPQISADDN